MKKYLIGSKLLRIENAKDVDLLVLKDIQSEEIIDQDWNSLGKQDISYCSCSELNNRLSFNRYSIKTLSNYQFDSQIIQQDFPIKYSILSHRDDLIAFLKTVSKKKLFNFDLSISIDGRYCSKIVYHIAYNIFILQNNSPIITNEQKEIIQKIHDIQMPIEYIAVLQNFIDKL